MLNNISSLIIPTLVLFVIVIGILKKIDIYDVFVDGSKESFDMILTLFPCFLAMIFGINIFVKSGLVEFLFGFLKNISYPKDIFPMMIMRPISGSAALAILNNIFMTYGPDSLIGRLGSIVQGSTDTTFYVLTLYFGSIGIKKIKYALWAGLFADLVGIISSIVLVNIFFS